MPIEVKATGWGPNIDLVLCLPQPIAICFEVLIEMMSCV